MIQTQENNEKPYFEPDLGPLDLNSGRKFFFQKSGFIIHWISCTISEKIMIQS